LVDVYVVHDGKEPRAKVGAAAIQVQFCPRTLEGVLHEIVGRCALAHQRSGVAPQPRNQLDQALGFVHGEQAERVRYSKLTWISARAVEAAGGRGPSPARP